MRPAPTFFEPARPRLDLAPRRWTSRPIEKRIRISSIRTTRTPSGTRSSTGSPSPVAAIPATALSAPHGQAGPARTRSCSCSANHRTG